jgi:hypothetical protein
MKAQNALPMFFLMQFVQHLLHDQSGESLYYACATSYQQEQQ